MLQVVDAQLFPADDEPTTMARSRVWRQAFVAAEGPISIVQLLLRLPSVPAWSSRFARAVGLPVLLRILKFALVQQHRVKNVVQRISRSADRVLTIMDDSDGYAKERQNRCVCASGSGCRVL